MEVIATITSFQKHPAYKDSGEIWLKDIPVHWEMRKGKFLFRKEERLVRAEDNIVTCFRDGQVTLRKNRRTDGFTNALKEYGYQGVRKGDLVIHAMDAFAGAIGVSDSDGKSTPVYSVCTPIKESRVNQYYYAYFLRNMANSNIILSLAKGIRERSTDFRFKDFGELNIAFPPIIEQNAIAAFLDDKIDKIDLAIAQKEKMIALLKERKQIIIQNALTKGLNPNAKMKDSGVEWIGVIPEGWEVKKLKNVAKINLFTLPENTPKSYIINYVDIGSVSFEKGIERTEFFEFKNAPSRARRIAKQGNTIISTVRTYLKAIDFISEEKCEFIYSTGFAVLEPQGLFEKYLYHFVRSNTFTEQVTFYAKGMSYPAINSSDLGRLFLAIPPSIEQTAIIAHIETQSAKIDKAIALQEQQIEKLLEFKATLIDGAVTGKMKIVSKFDVNSNL